MKTKALLIVCAGITALLIGCDNPASPNFKTNHQVQAPLVLSKTYTFLGGSGALIDTTSSNFDSLFSVAGSGLVSLSKKADFNFGSLDNALPVVSANAISSHSEVGPINIDNFSSQGSGGNIGSTSFQSVTGQNPTSFPAGTNLPGGNTAAPVNVALTTDYFTSAVIKNNGQLDLSLKNDLGFNITTLNLTLKSGTTTIGTTSVSPFNDGNTSTATIAIPAGTVMKNLNIDMTVSWATQNMARNPSDLIVQSATGKQLTASQVTAVVSSQKFTSKGSTVIDSTDFKFSKSTYYAQLKSGAIDINNIVNRIDLSVDTLRISFPGIRKSPYAAADSLVVWFRGANKIAANSSNVVTQNIDLSGYRIYALKNKLDYNIKGVTENTQNGSGSAARTLHDTDSLTASVNIGSLKINKAFGVITPKKVLLNTDDPSNGTGILDLNDTKEAKTISLGGISTLSKQLKGIVFENPILSMLYSSNLGVSTTIYAGIRGVSGDGTVIFLHGLSGSPYQVSSSSIPSGLENNGTTLTSSQLIKFSIKKSTNGSLITDAVNFDTTNTNIRDFFNNLPTDIRLIGVAKINDGGAAEGLIVDPVQFNPSMSVDLPLNFASSASTYSDTTSADLSSLPGSSGNSKLTDAKLSIDYTNKLPLKLQLSLVMLDGQSNVLTEVPLAGQSPNVIAAASVDPTTKFVSQANTGSLVISLNSTQLNVLNQTRKMIIKVTFNTTNSSQVKIKASDSITISLKMSVSIESNIH